MHADLTGDPTVGERMALLFPEAFGALVLGKTYHVAKSALVPGLVKEKDDLIEANSKLSLLSGVGGFLARLEGDIRRVGGGRQRARRARERGAREAPGTAEGAGTARRRRRGRGRGGDDGGEDRGRGRGRYSEEEDERKRRRR